MLSPAFRRLCEFNGPGILLRAYFTQRQRHVLGRHRELRLTIRSLSRTMAETAWVTAGRLAHHTLAKDTAEWSLRQAMPLPQ